MKTLPAFAACVLFVFHTGAALAQGTVDELKSYMAQKEEIKALELPAVQAIAANPKEKNSRRGLAEYYVFLKSPRPAGDVAAGTKSVSALLQAADKYMDPATFVKLATLYSNDYPDYGSKRDLTKCLRYLSILWEMADLADKATGDNALLTMVIDNTLGLGDGIFGDGSKQAELKKILDEIRPDVLKARERFKKMYGLSVKDETPGSTNVERHYGL